MANDLEYYLAQARRIAEHREKNAEKEIRKLYKSMLKDLRTFMGETYEKYAQEDKLTFGMMQAEGYNAKFLEEIERLVNKSTPKAAAEIKKLVEQTYEAAYTEMVKGVQRQGDGGLEAAFVDSVAVTPEQIKAAVENPISGLTLSDTLEKNRKDIVYNIKQAIGVGLMNGDRYTTMAKRIAEHVDGNYKKALAIARTETHRAREAGNADASVKVDEELKNGTSGLRMTKTWKSMKDERVRPQQRRKTKKGWKTTMRGNANHMKMGGQIVLADEMFDLGGGVTAMAPGLSGDAGNDINCRCYASYKMMTDAEYHKLTGKHFDGKDERAKMEKLQKEYDELNNSLQGKMQEAMSSGDFSKMMELQGDMTKLKTIESELTALKVKAHDDMIRQNGHSTQKEILDSLPESWRTKYSYDYEATNEQAISGAIRGWCGEGYTDMKHDYLLTSFVEKAERKWDSGTLYRGLSVDKDTLSELTAGSEFKLDGLSSWASSINPAMEFATTERNPVLMMDVTKGKRNAVSIKGFSDRPWEEEVLYGEDSAFRIVKVRRMDVEYMKSGSGQAGKYDTKAVREVTVVEVEEIGR